MDVEKDISTTNLAARVCVCAKFDKFLPVRSHFDTKRPVNFFHIATFPSPTFGPLFAFHCPLFFTKNNNLECCDVLKTVTVTSDQKRFGPYTAHKWSSGFMVLDVSYSRVLGQRPTFYCSFVDSELPRGLGAYVSPYLYSAINVQCSYEKTK